MIHRITNHPPMHGQESKQMWIGAMGKWLEIDATELMFQLACISEDIMHAENCTDSRSLLDACDSARTHLGQIRLMMTGRKTDSQMTQEELEAEKDHDDDISTG